MNSVLNDFNKSQIMSFVNSANVIIRRSSFSNYNYANANGIIRLENNATLLIEDVTFTSKLSLLYLERVIIC